MRRIFAPLVMGLVAIAPAQSLQQYLALRKQYKISQAVGVPTLETLIGTRIIEVQGVVKGTFRVGDRTAVMLERTDGDTEIIDADAVPKWLQGNEIAARLIVKASRTQEYASLKSQLIAAAPEQSIKAVEDEAAAKVEARRRLEGSKVSRGEIRATVAQPPKGRPARDWSLPASEVTPIYASFIKKQNRKLTNGEALRIAQGVIGFSIQYGVDARLIMAMVMVESGFDPSSTSSAGAMGLGQLMPGTAAGMGVGNPYDSIDNLNGCVRLVRGHLDKYRKKTGDDYQSLILMLAAYNAGSGAVRKYGGVPPYKQTQRYVQKVIGWYKALSGA
ncbi:MAG: hypothetical protein BGO01_21315 [Armatimonadetes bacterium 55-13]|nr:MAG: hypothetical protein BGO01_21315 [Armatimonadetes bacterium 55-13]